MTNPFRPQSFYFSWDVDPHITFTEQCDTLSIAFDRVFLALGRNQPTGLDQLPPYSFVIHSSQYSVPIKQNAGSTSPSNLLIPFVPNTQYIVCMYDKGDINTGGCQALYTVFNSSTPTTCNFTDAIFPQPLSVDSNGLERNRWVSRCKDIDLIMHDGQPPYSFSAQPALGVPTVEKTGITGNTFTWQNIMPFTSTFFITLYDANGSAWTLGPLHSDDGPSDCTSSAPVDKPILSSPAALAGSAVAMVFAGAVLALAAVYLFFKFRRSKAIRIGHYEVDQGGSIPLDTREPGPSGLRSMRSVDTRNVAVVSRNPAGHHAPVSIYAAEEPNIVELPPVYRDSRQVPTKPGASSGGIQPLSPRPQTNDWRSTTSLVSQGISVDRSGESHVASSSVANDGSGGTRTLIHIGNNDDSPRTPRRLPPIPHPSPSSPPISPPEKEREPGYF